MHAVPAQPALCLIACVAKPRPASEQELCLALPQLLKCLDLSTLKGIVGAGRLPAEVRQALAERELPWQNGQLVVGQGTLRLMAPLDAADYVHQLQTQHLDGVLAILAPAGWVAATPRVAPTVVRLPVVSHLPEHCWVFVFKDSFAKARYTRPGVVTV
jgi:hypothetical protein